MWLWLEESYREKKICSVIVMMGHRSVLEAKQVFTFFFLFILKSNNVFFFDYCHLFMFFYDRLLI